THIRQIGSRLMWRYVGVAVAEFFANYALQKYDAGVFDKDAYFSDFNVFEGNDIQTTDVFGSELAHPRTLREHVLKWFSIFAAQSLGTGTRAELLRKHGPFKGSLWYDDAGNSADPRRFALNESNKREEQAILESAVYDITSTVPWEVSKTAHLVGKVLMAINDLERNAGLNPASRDILQKLLYDCRRAKTEFSTIIETDAEVSGLYCTHAVVGPRFSGGERAYQKKFNSLTAGGLLGKKAGEILESSMTVEEKELALRAIGVQYVRAYDSDFALKTIPENLKKLGFDSAQEAYKNLDVLVERITDQKIDWNDVLTPMNMTRVDIQRRYRGNIVDFMSVVEKVGYKNAVQIFESAESVDDVVKYNEIPQELYTQDKNKSTSSD
ncbi:hypothetical protein HY484_04835, partial [Candidatus Woesearchaeota archaeon]|nr:hypothetical protein [Candidatus Woesearchaeota archaeon]